jgi:hypothetical protein
MSLQIKSLLLREELEHLNELTLGTTKPFIISKALTPIPGDKGYFEVFYAPIEGIYDDNSIPEVIVTFAHVRDNKYEMGFTINGRDTQAFKAPISYYLRIIKTVTLIITKFIHKINPEAIRLRGMDKENVYKPGQKDRIYFSFMQQEGPKLGYRVAQDGNGYLIMIKNKITN